METLISSSACSGSICWLISGYCTSNSSSGSTDFALFLPLPVLLAAFARPDVFLPLATVCDIVDPVVMTLSSTPAISSAESATLGASERAIDTELCLLILLAVLVLPLALLFPFLGAALP